jgi:hypothetical protein
MQWNGSLTLESSFPGSRHLRTWWLPLNLNTPSFHCQNCKSTTEMCDVLLRNSQVWGKPTPGKRNTRNLTLNSDFTMTLLQILDKCSLFWGKLWNSNWCNLNKWSPVLASAEFSLEALLRISMLLFLYLHNVHNYTKNNRKVKSRARHGSTHP